jgi:WD40 repeat protein
MQLMKLQVYDLRKGEELTVLGGHTDAPTSLSLSPDGTLFFTSRWWPDLTVIIRIVHLVTIPIFADHHS